MTKDDIIKLARQAGGTAYVNRHYPGETAMAFSNGTLLQFAALVAQAEREECAKVCELQDIESFGVLPVRAAMIALSCAEAIRARNQPAQPRAAEPTDWSAA